MVREDVACVGMCVYKDYDIARDAIKSVWNNTPYGMFVIDDGGYDESFHEFCDDHYIDYQAGDRLYPLRNGGAWLERLLSYFIKHYSVYDYLIKIDTDTRIWEPLFIPEGVEAMGVPVVCPRTEWQFLAGGCRVTSKETVEKILTSKVLEDPCYQSYPFDYVRYRKHDGEILVSEDRVFAHVCDRLDIPKTPTDQMYIRWDSQEVPFDLGREFRVSHPHYDNYYR